MSKLLTVSINFRNMIRKLIVTLVLIGIFVLSAGCAQNNGDSPKYLSQADLLIYSLDENDEMDQSRQFETQLKEFYEFSQEFFTVWTQYIEESEFLLEKFNNENTPRDEKLAYSQDLRKKYEKFSHDLMQITPPPEASKAYQYALDAIAKRIMFLEKFEQVTDTNTLAEIENEAYFTESLFWEEIDKIYDYFDQMAEQLGIANDYKGLDWI
ncbi:MAG: hypothetical protein ACQEP5_00535 [Actinomycetota bacterium]